MTRINRELVDDKFSIKCNINSINIYNYIMKLGFSIT